MELLRRFTQSTFRLEYRKALRASRCLTCVLDAAARLKNFDLAKFPFREEAKTNGYGIKAAEGPTLGDGDDAQSTPNEPQPESLRLDQVEITSMKQLAGIIGRSPRETKRFVNVYRLMKAALSHDELANFVGTGATPGSFRVPMCLLALSTGAPHVASILFRQVVVSDKRSNSTGDVSLNDLMTSVKSRIPVSMNHEWNRVHRFLDRSSEWGGLIVERQWVTRVSHFSFEPAIAPLADDL